jgi:cytochrome c oxidase assembly protein subunit 15
MKVLAVAAGFAQLVLGALLRHTRVGITAHIAGAVVMAALCWMVIARILRRHRDDARLESLAVRLVLLLIVQVFLGFGALALKYFTAAKPQADGLTVTLATAHLAGGALILGTLVVMAMETHKRLGELVAAAPNSEAVAR